MLRGMKKKKKSRGRSKFTIVKVLKNNMSITKVARSMTLDIIERNP